MPIILTRPNVEENENLTLADLETEAGEFMLDEDGDFTTEGAFIDNFLENIDWSAAFENPELQEHIVRSEACLVPDPENPDVLIDAPDDLVGEDAIVYNVETLPKEVLAEAIDEDDLVAMFIYHIENEIDESTLIGKSVKSIMTNFLDEGRGKKPKGVYQKGEFARLSQSGGKARALVNRMLGAMLAKGDIHKAEAGNKKRYKAKGAKGGYTYTRAYTSAGSKDPVLLNKDEVTKGKRTHANWMKYKKTNKSSIVSAAQKTVGAKTKASGGGKVTSDDIKKITGKKSSVKKALIKNGGAKKIIPVGKPNKGQATTSKNVGKPDGAKKKKGSAMESIEENVSGGAASVMNDGDLFNINESARCISRVLAKRRGPVKSEMVEETA